MLFLLVSSLGVACAGGASYTFYIDGSDYKAKNDLTGSIDFSGTDGADVLQDTIDSLTTGGKIFLRHGVYTLDRDIELKNHISLIGEGGDLSLVNGTVLKGYNITTAVLKTTSQITITICDLAVSVRSGSASACAIKVTPSDRSYIGGIAINSAPLDGLFINGGGVALIENIRIDNVGRHGAVFYYVSDGVIRFIDTTAGSANSGRGIMITGGGHLRVYSCNTYLGYIGIEVSYAEDVDLIGVRANDNTQVGICVGDSTTKSIRFIGGSSYCNGESGYRIYNGKDVSLVSVKSYNNHANGIKVEGGSNINIIDAGVYDDQMTHTQYRGLSVTGGDKIRISDFKSPGGHIYYDVNLSGGTNVSLRGGQFTSVYNTVGAEINDVTGYVTAKSGVASVSNGGTIAHGLAGIPTTYNVTTTVPGYIAVVTGVDGTNLTIGLHRPGSSGGIEGVTTPASVSWHAEYHPQP